MTRIFRNGFFVFVALVFMGCATGKPLLIADLDEIGWNNTASFQCYLSSKLTLTKLPDDDSGTSIGFSQDGAALVRDARWTIVLPVSLEGRIHDYHQRDQFLYVAFEDGDAVLPFARDENGRFSLMVTVDQRGVEFVEYEGVRYNPGYTGSPPHLNVVINRSQDVLRREMQGSQVRAASNTEAAIHRVSEKFIAGLPENSIIAVLNISADERDTALFIIDELQFQLVESGKFKVVDRKSLDLIRTEQNFQMSGEVSDESAVSIGSLLGANIVITGSISGSGSARRLTLKALDVKTGEITANAREPL
jgi:TolB-like protein